MRSEHCWAPGREGLTSLPGLPLGLMLCACNTVTVTRPCCPGGKITPLCSQPSVQG